MTRSQIDRKTHRRYFADFAELAKLPGANGNSDQQ